MRDLPTLTREQAPAIDPASTVWVDASAGSGKTQVLTARVLRLLVEGVAPSAILCLTFTKAAAAEMSQRVMDVLAAWVVSPDARIGQDMQTLGMTPNAERIAYARGLFANVLETDGGLRFQTIHAFCQSLLARFPLEAGIDPGFTVIEEVERNVLIMRSLATLVAEAVADHDQSILRDLALITGRMGDTKLSKFVQQLVNYSAVLSSIEGLGALGLDAIVENAFDVADEPRFDRWLETAMPLGLREDVILIADALKRSKSSAEQERGVLMANALTSVGDGLVTQLAAAMLTTKRAVYVKFFNKDTAQANPDAIAALARVEPWLLDALGRQSRSSGAELAKAALRIGTNLSRRYVTAKWDEGVLDFAELIERARQLLVAADQGDLAWIMRKLDTAIDHILVDEGQDTNRDQWDIVEALSREFYAGQSARDGRRSVFSVGDFNQSIYGFQGARPDDFQTASTAFETKSASAAIPFVQVSLTESFRSTDAVLQLVNAMFVGDDAPAAGLGSIMLRHHAHRAKAHGRLELWPLVIGGDDDDEPAGDATPATRNQQSQSAVERYAALIAAQVRRWIGTVPLASRGGQVAQAGDILILLRKRGKLARPLLQALKAEGVPVAGFDRLALMETQAALDCLSLMRFASLPDDDLSLAEVLTSPFLNWDQEILCALAAPRDPGVTLWSALANAAADGQQQAAEARAWLLEVLSLADWAPPFTFLMQVLDGLSGRARLFARLGNDAEEPLASVLDLALDHQSRQPPSLQSFVQWLESYDQPLKREQEGRDERVRILTVHGAKGLQAPIVILAETVFETDKASPWIEMQPTASAKLPLLYGRQEALSAQLADLLFEREQRDAQEDLRLLYVALTRAQDWLCAGGCGKKENAVKEDSWYRLMEQGFELLAATQAESGGVWEAHGPVRAYDSGQAITVQPTHALAQHATPPLPLWATRPAPVERIVQPLTPSRAAEPSASLVPSAGALLARSRGQLSHKLLEILPAVPVADRRKQGQAWLARHGADLTAAAQNSLLDQVLVVLATPAFAAVFADTALAEVPVSAIVEGRLIQGEIDRLLVTDDRVLIVDYKTNSEPPQDAAGTPPAILVQMAAYYAAISRVFPDRPVESAILWTATPKLIPLDFKLLVPYLPGPATGDR